MADTLDIIRDWLGMGETSNAPATGQSARSETLNRDKQKIVEIVEECARKSYSGIAIADIVSAAKPAGIDEHTTRILVDELVRDGYLVRPSHMRDMVRLHGVTDYSPCSEDFPS